MLDVGGVEVGLHSVHLYNAVFRFADQFEQIWKTTTAYPGGRPR